jgi:hypothetical protein
LLIHILWFQCTLDAYHIDKLVRYAGITRFPRSSSNNNNNDLTKYYSRRISAQICSTSPHSSESVGALTSENIKSILFAKCASCDRGFTASQNDQSEIRELVNKLKSYKSTTAVSNPTEGLRPNLPNDPSTGCSPPLEGVWQMVYTSAFDVLSLNINPFTIVQGIYQKINRTGDTINVIDIGPRTDVLLPSSLRSSLRLKVLIDAYARSPVRVGLQFKRVEIEAKSFLGQSITMPTDWPSFGINFPQLSKKLFGLQDEPTASQGPGFFDVEYLDRDTLIIAQNAPGGYFISIRNDNVSI